MAYLTGVLLRSLKQGPLEERMARLEEALGLGPDGGATPGTKPIEKQSVSSATARKECHTQEMGACPRGVSPLARSLPGPIPFY